MASKRTRRPRHQTVLTEHDHALLDELKARFEQIPEPRMAGKVIYPLATILLIALCSILSDNCDFTEMEAFAETQEEWLRGIVTLPEGSTPSHDVFRNVFMMLKPAALLSFLPQMCGDLSGTQVCVDGKAVRGSADKSTGSHGVYLLRAWVKSVGLSVAHQRCDDKTNEIGTLPSLLSALELTGALVTIDAMGCHPHIAEQIHKAGGDYLMCLKANEKNAFTEVGAYFLEHEPEPPALTELSEQTPLEGPVLPYNHTNPQ